jgi:hypothetical protein
MLKDKVTVPELIAGSISAGSAEAYMGRFARIFDALGLPKATLGRSQRCDYEVDALGQQSQIQCA